MASAFVTGSSSADEQMRAAAAAAVFAPLGASSSAPCPLLAPEPTIGPPLVASRAFGRHYYNNLAIAQDEAVAVQRKQVDMAFALERARQGLLQPVVQLPTEPIRRDA